MFIEERIYRLKVGAIPEYLRNYQELGMHVQLRHLPHMLGYYYSEIGEQNLIVHMWAYESLDQRELCRTAMRADPDWAAYLLRSRPLMEVQQTRIMKCAPFFLESLKRMLAATQGQKI